jgi:hypothetical protein
MLADRATSILSEPRRDEAVASVSRDTTSERRSSLRAARYGDARSVRGARLRKKLLDAALALIADGKVRATLLQICTRAGVRPNAINEQFGYGHLLYRQLVRERPVDVLVALRLPGDLPEADRIELAWMILTGSRPEKLGGRS